MTFIILVFNLTDMMITYLEGFYFYTYFLLSNSFPTVAKDR